GLWMGGEVQWGLGGRGSPLYDTELGLKPHLMSIGKALGGGVPIGAALISDEVANTISYGDHGSTYGGNLLACRAALWFLNELTEGGVIENVRRIGQLFDERLHAMQAKYKFIKDVRGVGLIWGLELSSDAARVVKAGLASGVIVNRTAETVVRLLPPLNITKEEASEALGRLDAALAAAGVGA